MFSPMPMTSPPRVTKVGLKRAQEKRDLLKKRRGELPGAPKVKPPKFKPRLQRWPITIETMDEAEEVARDVPYQIDEKNSLLAVLQALADFEGRMKKDETIHCIRVGEPAWLPKVPIGRQT